MANCGYGEDPFERRARDARDRRRLLCVGGEDHALRIPFLTRLQERGFEVTAAGAGSADAFSRAGIPFARYEFDRFGNPAGDVSALRRLQDIVETVRPDVVQSFDTKPNILAPLAVRNPGIRVVRTVNGMGWVYSARSPLAIAARPVYRAMTSLAGRRTSATVFQNREDKSYFERSRLVGRGLSRLIPSSGIDIAGFERAKASGPGRQALRAQLGLGDCEVVTTVSRLTRAKGIRTLLAAAALVHLVRPNVRFLLVGPLESEGPLAVPASEIERHAPYVQALGARADVPSILDISDAFVLPTEYREGVPRALLEAALAGLPIVTTTMPGCGEVVRDGSTGFLTPPRAPGFLAARILDVLGDHDRSIEMGRRAAHLVRESFGLDAITSQYANLYQELLEAGEVAGGETSSRA